MKKPTKKSVKSTKKPSKLTAQQQLAVAVAKDVIKQIKNQSLRINNNGQYVGGFVPLDCGISPNTQIKPYLPTLKKHCDVCAKGALFLSYIELKNKVTFGGCGFGDTVGPNRYISFTHDGVRETMLQVFSEQTFTLIEEAFEGWDGSKAFVYDYKEPADRMIAICKNIIKNKGEFKP